MKLSQQALVQLMIALQKAIAEETDIVPILMGFDWYSMTEGDMEFLYVQNPITHIKPVDCEDIMPPDEEDEDNANL